MYSQKLRVLMRRHIDMKSRELFLALSLAATTGMKSRETVNASGFNLDSDRTDTIAYVVKPDGNGGLELIANMLAEEWTQL